MLWFVVTHQPERGIQIQQPVGQSLFYVLYPNEKWGDYQRLRGPYLLRPLPRLHEHGKLADS